MGFDWKYAALGPIGAGLIDAVTDPDSIARRIVRETAGRTLGGPALLDQVVVEVTGQPGITKQQLYFLALAAANGIVRRFGDLISTAASFGELAIEYDAADHWVRCTISYKWAMWAMATDAPVTDPNRQIGRNMDRMAVYRGPQCDVVGGRLDFRTDVVGDGGVGLPNPDARPPALPFRGQPILTSCPTTPTPVPTPINVAPAPTLPTRGTGPVIPSPNPKPPGDNRSRGDVVVPSTSAAAALAGVGLGGVVGGSPVPGPTPDVAAAKCCDKLLALVPLVFSALSGPATNSGMTYPTPTLGPTGG